MGSTGLAETDSLSSTLKAVWNTELSSRPSWSWDRAERTWLKGSSELASALSTTPFTRLSSCLKVGSPAHAYVSGVWSSKLGAMQAAQQQYLVQATQTLLTHWMY